jgi:crotonobetaine/carnitine-CoA ligase
MTDAARWQAFLKSQETLPAIVDRMAAADPDRTFAIFHTGAALTWGETKARADAWAARLSSFGVRRGDVVATLLDAGLEALCLWLGCCRIGAIDAAVNAQFRGRMLAYAINHCRPAVLVFTSPYRAQVEAVREEIARVPSRMIMDSFSLEANAAEEASCAFMPASVDESVDEYLPPQWHDIACITYTSGTTGPSKAVRLPWGQLHSINLASFPFEDLGSADVIYCTTPHAHFGSKAMPYLAAMVGGRVVMRPRFSQSAFWRDIETFGITTASLVASMADVIAADPAAPNGATTLRNVFMAPLGAAYRKFKERFGARICTVYNSTEGGVAIASGWDPEDDRTIGRLREGYPGFEVRLVDEYDYEVPDGTPGELIVRSAVPWTMNDGFHNNPEATAAAWRNGWFHSGDLIKRLPSGDYVFVDRLKDAIRRRGENISSYEVEAEVLAHPDILECAAVAAKQAGGEDEILLFAVTKPGSSLEPRTLHAHLTQQMPRFMTPRFIEFVDALPKTVATGRVVKADLRQRGVGPMTWDCERE